MSWHGKRAVALSFSMFSVEVRDLPRITQLGTVRDSGFGVITGLRIEVAERIF